LVAAIEQAHSGAVQTDMRAGSGGIFDVALDGELVFRKWDENRFPTNAEILDQIAAHLKKA
jgi:selT/selW/selH-like putative selenoprotein